MKKLIAVIFILTVMINIFPADRNFNINKNWIDVQNRQRAYFEKRDLLKLDTQTIEILETSTLPAELEPELSDLLYEIIKYDAKDEPKNSIRAFKLLEQKFSDKSLFFDKAKDFANNYAEDNPVILAQIFLSMKGLLVGHYEENVKTLQIIYESIRGHYIIGAKNGTQKYKTDVVLDYLKKYLAEYDKLQDERSIDTDTPLDQIVIRIKSELDAYQL